MEITQNEITVNGKAYVLKDAVQNLAEIERQKERIAELEYFMKLAMLYYLQLLTKQNNYLKKPMENKKVIVINGCKACPYNINRVGRPWCGHIDHSLPFAAVEDESYIDLRCKLNDLPSEEDIENACWNYDDDRDFTVGANYIINQITKNGS